MLRGQDPGVIPPTRLSALPAPLIIVLAGLCLAGALAAPLSAARLLRHRRTVA